MKNQSPKAQIAFAAIAFLLLLVVLFNSTTKNRFTTNASRNSTYSQQIEENVKKLDADRKRERDSVYAIYIRLPLYKTLYLEKITDADYIPLVSKLGYVLIHRRENTFTLPTSDTANFKTPENIFLLMSAYLDFRGGYISEFEDLVNRYVEKYGYYFGARNNLYYAKLYVDPYDKKALDAMAEICGEWESRKAVDDNNQYVHPQFVFAETFMGFLKQHYPQSKNIIPPPPPVQILKKSVKYESAMNGYYVYCTVKNNTTELIKYIDASAIFYDRTLTVVGTGIGNTSNLAPGAQRTLTILAPNIENEAKYKIELGNVVY